MKKVFFYTLLTAALCNACVASEEKAFALNRQRMMKEQIEYQNGRDGFYNLIVRKSIVERQLIWLKRDGLMTLQGT